MENRPGSRPPPAVNAKAPVLEGPGLSGKTARTQPNDSATPPARQAKKWSRVLQAFVDRGEVGWNRFQAARDLRDHVLPTTVDQLQKRGVRILRRTETVPGYMGAPTECCRYWIAPDSLPRARELLASPAGASTERAAAEPA